MITLLINYLKSKTDLTNNLEKITYRKPISDKQNRSYLYVTYKKARVKEWYKYRVQFNFFCKNVTDMEILPLTLECLLVWWWRVPKELKQNIPKLWKTLLISHVPFSDEMTVVTDYEFYYNF